MFIWKTAILSLLVLWTAASTAQHSHGVLSPGTTFPKDDSVLVSAPQSIILSFRVDVRLLKLILLAEDGRWVDIGFRYDPDRVGDSFVYPLQESLPPAKFYTVKWSVLGDNNELMNGEFSFAFGDGAIPPGEYLENLDSGLTEILPETGSYHDKADEK